jgi:putative hydrolase, CocE/NonD family
MTGSIEIYYDVEMRTRDGVTLRSDIYRPVREGRVPAILLRTPYGKSSTRTFASMLPGLRPERAASEGFAFVIQDMRGCGASDGEFNLFQPTEGLDGYDTVEWLAAEPWCCGRVGMIGASMSGSAQLTTAQEQPPSLRAIIPERTTGSSAVSASMLDSTIIAWAAAQAAARIKKGLSTGATTRADLAAVTEMLNRPQSVAWHLPLDDAPFIQLSGFHTYQQIVDHLLHSVTAPNVSRIQVPAFLTSGWYDLAPGEACDLFSNLSHRAGTPQAREGTRLLIGPWDHSACGTFLGECFFGNHASAAGADLAGLQLKFLSRWLRDDDSDIPVVSYFVMGANVWKEAEHWPPSGTTIKALYLSSNGQANSVWGDGRLVWEMPNEELPDIFVYNPHQPVPSFGGHYYALGGSVPGPFDQSRIERRSDVLVYTSDVAMKPLAIVGPVCLRLQASSSAVDTDFVVKLCDVAPNGLSLNVADGFFRCRWRKGYNQNSPLKPDTPEAFTIDLGAVAHVFLPGHKLRLQISSSAFPAYDRNMNTGNPPGVDTKGIAAIQTVYHSSMLVSALMLPVQTENV